MKDDRDLQLPHSAASARRCLSQACQHIGKKSPNHSGLTEPASSSPSIQGSHVGIHVVNPKRQKSVPIYGRSPSDYCNSPIAVRWSLSSVPGTRDWELAVKTPLRLGFVIHTVESYNPLEEDVQFRVRGWILCNLEQGLEDVCMRHITLSRPACVGRSVFDSLRIMSWKLSICLAPLKTSYNLGT